MLKLKRNFVINVKTYSNLSSDEEYEQNCNNYETNVESSQQSIQLNANNCFDICDQNNKSVESEHVIQKKTFTNDVLLESKVFDNSIKTLRSGEKFCNFKVVVESCGQTSERFVENINDLDTKQNKLSSVPELNDCCNYNVVRNEGLKQIIDCKDLKEIETILMNTNPKQIPQQKRRFSKENKSKKKEFEANKSSIDEKTIFINNYNSFNVNKTVREKKSLKYDVNDSQILELEVEGIQIINYKTGERLKCLVCDKSYIKVRNAIIHSQSDSHSKMKFGDNLRGIDALFTIDSESIGDVEIAIARRIELAKTSISVKQKYFNHGIRLKNGIGCDAYVCLKCNISLESLSKVEKHFQYFNQSNTSFIKETSNAQPQREDRAVRPHESQEMTQIKERLNDSGSADGKYVCKKQYQDESQVFVGNIPLNIVEKDLKSMFAKYGKIVDVHLIRKNQKKGSSVEKPSYGYITFESPDIVQQILKQKPIYFDNKRYNVEAKRSHQRRGSPNFDRNCNYSGGMSASLNSLGHIRPNYSQSGRSSANQRNNGNQITLGCSSGVSREVGGGTGEGEGSGAKLGQNLKPKDTRFFVNSDGIHKSEVAFGRNDLFKTKQLKKDFLIEGIRLEDGLGFDAFVCQKCGLSIPSFEEIEAHIESSGHSNNSWPLIEL